MLVDQGSQANFVPVDTADYWLHLVLGVVMMGGGFAFRQRSARITGAGRAV